jgi:serine/threonine-protein kinase RsbW
LDTAHFQQTFRACFGCLSDVGALIHKASDAAGLDEVSRYQVETAVDEACSNIIEHAYEGEDLGDITIVCESQPGILTVKLLDTGKPFNPEMITPPKFDIELEDRPDRGLGLFFMRRWMNSVHFEFSDQTGNVLTMVKKAEITL